MNKQEYEARLLQLDENIKLAEEKNMIMTAEHFKREKNHLERFESNRVNFLRSLMRLDNRC